MSQDRFDKLELMIGKIDEKLDKQDEKLEKQGETLIRNTASLEKHEYRTTLAEKRLDIVEKDLAPLKDSMKFKKQLKSYITYILGLAAAAFGILEYFKK